MQFATKKLIIDYGLVKPSTEVFNNDSAILRHILEYGCSSVVQGNGVTTEAPDSQIKAADTLKYLHASEAEKLELKE